MTTVTKTPTTRHQELKLMSKPKLIISDRIHSHINHMHRIVGKLEWSGPLFYSIVSGSLRDPANLVLKAEMLYPKNVGTSGYTEYSFDEKILDFYEKYPEVEHMKLGHIHTHHSMSTFFSGTDTDELHDNAPNHAYYLSLIVNFDCDWKAKIAFMGEDNRIETRVMDNPHIKFNDGESEDARIEMEAPQVSPASRLRLITLDCDLVYTEDTDFLFFASEALKTKPVYTPYVGTTNYGTTGSAVGTSYPANSRAGFTPGGTPPTDSKKTLKDQKEVQNQGNTKLAGDISTEFSADCLDFLRSWLDVSYDTALSLNSVLAQRNAGKYPNLYMNKLDEFFDDAYEAHFYQSDHSVFEVVLKCIEFLEPYDTYVIVADHILPYLYAMITVDETPDNTIDEEDEDMEDSWSPTMIVSDTTAEEVDDEYERWVRSKYGDDDFDNPQYPYGYE